MNVSIEFTYVGGMKTRVLSHARIKIDDKWSGWIMPSDTGEQWKLIGVVEKRFWQSTLNQASQVENMWEVCRMLEGWERLGEATY